MTAETDLADHVTIIERQGGVSQRRRRISATEIEKQSRRPLQPLGFIAHLVVELDRHPDDVG